MMFSKDVIEILQFLNLLIIPLIIYVVRIERRIAMFNLMAGMVKRSCPIFNDRGCCPPIRNQKTIGGSCYGETETENKKVR